MLVSALGRVSTAIGATIAVRYFGVSIETGLRIEKSMVLLGGASALALVLGQYPYLYLTVAFIQMLKAFSPAYMVIFLYCLGVEKPSRRVIACVLGLSVCTCIASAGEVNFSVIGVLFMAAASISDALRLVVAQRLLSNMKMNPLETLYFISRSASCGWSPPRCSPRSRRRCAPARSRCPSHRSYSSRRALRRRRQLDRPCSSSAPPPRPQDAHDGAQWRPRDRVDARHGNDHHAGGGRLLGAARLLCNVHRGEGLGKAQPGRRW